LEEGGSVDLNTSSRLQVLTTRGRQALILERGEAYFRSGAKNLQVYVEDLSISADKSSFSIRSHGRGNVDVLALDGQLHVNSVPARAQWAMQRGQVATIRTGTVSLHVVDSAYLQRKLMWRYGMLEFYNEPIEDIAQEFNRYSRTKLIVDDASVRQLRLGGRFSEYDLESFIATACKVFPLRPQMLKTAAGPTVRLRFADTNRPAALYASQPPPTATSISQPAPRVFLFAEPPAPPGGYKKPSIRPPQYPE